MEALNSWKNYERKEMQEKHDKYISKPEYKNLVCEAEKKGFKPAPLWMCLAWPTFQDVIYKWRGGCWLKKDYVIQQ